MRKFELEYKEETGCNVGVYCKDNVWYFNQHYVEWLEAKIEALSQHDVIKNEVEFCTCGNPSGEGNIQMVNDEELLYFCCDCNKQVQN